MRVWPQPAVAGPSLATSEGSLVSISVSVDPRRLEALLEALAQIGFPINPQIYHNASYVYVYPDGHEEAEPTTLVEFPAYAQRLDEVRRALEANGFDPHSAEVVSMLDEIHRAPPLEPAPPGAKYRARYRMKQRTAAALH